MKRVQFADKDTAATFDADLAAAQGYPREDPTTIWQGGQEVGHGTTITDQADSHRVLEDGTVTRDLPPDAEALVITGPQGSGKATMGKATEGVEAVPVACVSLPEGAVVVDDAAEDVSDAVVTGGAVTIGKGD